MEEKIEKININNIRDKLHEVISNLSDRDLVAIWNEYCDKNNYEERMYSMDDLDEIEQSQKPSEIINKLDDEFSLNDDYFFYRLGNLCSTSAPLEHVYIYDLVDCIIRDDESLDNDEVQEILDEWDEHIDNLLELEENEPNDLTEEDLNDLKAYRGEV